MCTSSIFKIRNTFKGERTKFLLEPLFFPFSIILDQVNPGADPECLFGGWLAIKYIYIDNKYKRRRQGLLFGVIFKFWGAIAPMTPCSRSWVNKRLTWFFFFYYWKLHGGKKILPVFNVNFNILFIFFIYIFSINNKSCWNLKYTFLNYLIK